MSQSEITEVSLNLDRSFFIGAGLALGAAFTGAAASVIVIGLGIKLAKRLPASLTEKHGATGSEVFCTTLLMTISHLISTPVSFAIGYAGGEILYQEFWFSAFLIGGILISTGGTLFWRVANLLTDRPEINSIVYFRIVASLFALHVFAGVSVTRPLLLLVGSFLIASSNTMINLRTRSSKRPATS